MLVLFGVVHIPRNVAVVDTFALLAGVVLLGAVHIGFEDTFALNVGVAHCTSTS